MACRSSVTSEVSVVVSTAEVRAVTVTSSATVAGASVKLTVRRAPTVIVTSSSLPAAKPGNSARMPYRPGGSRLTPYIPMGPDTAARVRPLSRLTTVTVTPGSTPPVASSSSPVISAVVARFWASAGMENRETAIRTKHAFSRSMDPLDAGGISVTVCLPGHFDRSSARDRRSDFYIIFSATCRGNGVDSLR